MRETCLNPPSPVGDLRRIPVPPLRLQERKGVCVREAGLLEELPSAVGRLLTDTGLRVVTHAVRKDRLELRRF